LKVKKVVKFLIGFGVTIFVIALIGAALADESPQEPTKPAAVVKDSEPVKAPEKPAEKANDPRINLKEFEAIENGMTYEEVVAIVGGEGQVLSEVGKKGEPMYTIMIMYEGEEGIGANANFMFQDGELQSKAQLLLK
jgi:hypothetical protein